MPSPSDSGRSEHEPGRPAMEWDNRCIDGSYSKRCADCLEPFDENTAECPWCGAMRERLGEERVQRQWVIDGDADHQALLAQGYRPARSEVRHGHRGYSYLLWTLMEKRTPAEGGR